MALMPVSHCHAASAASRMATRQAITLQSRRLIAGAPASPRRAAASPPREAASPRALLELLAERVPDPAVLGEVLRALADADHVARPRQPDVVDHLDPP